MPSPLRFYQPLLALLLLGATPSRASSPALALPQPTGLSFIANRGQWAEPIQYQAELPGGTVFLTQTGLVYDWRGADDARIAHETLTAKAKVVGPAAVRKHHAVFVDFLGARPAALSGEQLRPNYNNYFLGNDQSHWASKVPLFEAVRYASLYPGTDLRCYSSASGQLEYDFMLAPGANPTAVALRYRGATALQLRADGSLLVRTSVADVREQRPVAYQPSPNGEHRPVACRYVLDGNTIRFAFPAGFNKALPLVIDPVVDFVSYSGSRGDMYGCCTTYDAAGNVYTGGQAIPLGLFPTTPGAFQANSGGGTDVGIAKFNRAGTALLYTTYLGGASSDIVFAMRVTAADELCVLTSTTSLNFPVTPGCFRSSNNGSGDLSVTKLNATGTALIGSTYLGGSGIETAVELITNAAGGIYVLGNTESSTFPTTAGSLSRTLRGGRDAFVSYFNANLSALNWSTFLGGSSSETGYDLALTANDEPVVVGNTSSTDFPVTAGAYQTTSAGITSFVARLRADGTALQASTFFGPANITKLTLEASGAPVIAGSTSSTFPTATPGALNAGTGTFITGLASDLRSIRYTARMPATNILEAFGADDCGHLFLGAFGSSPLPLLNPLPNTQSSAAYFSITLEAGASRVLFSTTFGPSLGGHAHAHSHRFDRTGRLYQSVCESSGGYPTTAASAVRAKQTSGFDMLTFVINQSVGSGSAAPLRASIAAVDSSCAPFRLAFGNSSTGANRYRWTFGDGSAADTARAPAHTFTAPGTYRVRLLATRDITGICQSAIVTDSAFVTVRVLTAPLRSLPPSQLICPGNNLTLTTTAGTGYTYRWSTGATTRSVVVQAPGTYRVDISNGRCSTRDSVVVRSLSNPKLVADTVACTNNNMVLQVRADAGSTFRWANGQTTDRITVSASGTYAVEVRSNGCVFQRQARVTLHRLPNRINVITPNGDTQNETFQPTPLTAGTKLRVFNRWGKLVFSSDNYQNDWGKGQQAGVYYYTAENEDFCERYLKGWVEVIP